MLDWVTWVHLRPRDTGPALGIGPAPSKGKWAKITDRSAFPIFENIVLDFCRTARVARRPHSEKQASRSKRASRCDRRNEYLYHGYPPMHRRPRIAASW